MKDPQAMTREELEDEVIILRGELIVADESDRLAHWRSLGLKTSAARVMFALHRASPRCLSKAYLMDVASSGDIDRYLSDKIAHVYVCLIRKLLGAEAIENDWGRGYRMTPLGVAALKALDFPVDLQPSQPEGLKVTALQRVGRGR